jgi:hypothetical protein
LDDLDTGCPAERTRLRDEASERVAIVSERVAIVVASKKTARRNHAR